MCVKFFRRKAFLLLSVGITVYSHSGFSAMLPLVLGNTGASHVSVGSAWGEVDLGRHLSSLLPFFRSTQIFAFILNFIFDNIVFFFFFLLKKIPKSPHALDPQILDPIAIETFTVTLGTVLLMVFIVTWFYFQSLRTVSLPPVVNCISPGWRRFFYTDCWPVLIFCTGSTGCAF